MSEFKSVQSNINFSPGFTCTKKEISKVYFVFCEQLNTGKEYMKMVQNHYLHLNFGTVSEVAGVSQSGNNVSFGG